MKFTVLLCSTFLSLVCPAQHTGTASGFLRIHTPFKESGEVVDCRRTWMMPKERMDSLKREVKKLEEQLTRLEEMPANFTSASFVQLFQSEYEVRMEFNGEINEHFCVSDSDAGKTFRVFDSGEAAFDEIRIYDGKYLVVKGESYYLGNCQKLTTVKTYYVRSDYRE